jgi:Nuclease-related domain
MNMGIWQINKLNDLKPIIQQFREQLSGPNNQRAYTSMLRDFDIFDAALNTDLEELENLLISIESRIDVEQLFVCTAVLIALHPKDSDHDDPNSRAITNIEWLAKRLYPYFEQNSKPVPTVHDIRHMLYACQMLPVVEHLSSFATNTFDPDDLFAQAERSLKAQAELVRGETYPNQRLREFEEFMVRFDNPLTQALGISPSKAAKIIRSILKTTMIRTDLLVELCRDKGKERSKEWKAASDKLESERTEDDILILKSFDKDEQAHVFGNLEMIRKFAYYVIPIALTDLNAQAQLCTNAEWNALVNLVGFQSGQQGYPRTKPLYVLEDGRVLLFNLAGVLDRLFHHFDTTAVKILEDRYTKKRASWLENRTTAALKQVFQNHVYSNVKYPDPDKLPGSETECDVIVLWDNYLVVVEVKSKAFYTESLDGQISTAQLQRGMANNVGDAHEQAQRTLRYLESTHEAIFRESSTGHEFTVRLANLKGVYVLSVTHQNLRGMNYLLRNFQGKGMFRNGNYPVSLSVDDLEIVTEFARLPEVFLKYLEVRAVLLKIPCPVTTTELDIFGLFIERKLDLESIEVHARSEDAGNVILFGGQNRFDSIMLSRLEGKKDDGISVNLYLPTYIEKLFESLRQKDYTEATPMIMALLDLPRPHLEQLATALEKAELLTAESGVQCLQYRDFLVVLVNDSNMISMKSLNRSIAIAEEVKYRNRACRVVLLSYSGLDKKILGAHFEFPWVLNMELETKKSILGIRYNPFHP